MRRVVGVALTVVLAAGAAWIAAPAGASVAAKDAKFCRAAAGVGDSVSLPGATGIDKKAAARLAKALKKASKSGPSKVRKAARRLAGIYRRLARGDSIIDVLTQDGTDFADAVAVFGTYFTKNCVGRTLPTVPSTLG